MQDLALLFASIMNLAKTPFTIYGFTLSCWQIFIWVLVGSVIIWLLNQVFGG